MSTVSSFLQYFPTLTKQISARAADTAFEAAAEAALGITTPLSPTFDGVSNDVFFLAGEFLAQVLDHAAFMTFFSTRCNYRRIH